MDKKEYLKPASALVDIEIDDIVTEQPPDKKLQRHVIYAFYIFFGIGVYGFQPAFYYTITHAVGKGGIFIPGRYITALDLGVTHMPCKIILKSFYVHFDATVAFEFVTHFIAPF